MRELFGFSKASERISASDKQHETADRGVSSERLTVPPVVIFVVEKAAKIWPRFVNFGKQVKRTAVSHPEKPENRRRKLFRRMHRWLQRPRLEAAAMSWQRAWFDRSGAKSEWRAPAAFLDLGRRRVRNENRKLRKTHFSDKARVLQVHCSDTSFARNFNEV